MTKILSLLTIVLFLGIAGNALAQREVPPPANTPLDAKPSVAQTKAAAKSAESAKTTAKAKTAAKPAPVQAATVPITTESKTAASQAKPVKAKKSAKATEANASAKKSATADKPKKPKSPRICKTTAKSDRKLAKTKKDSIKTAKKPEHKQVIRATTVPAE
jgi:hypothetical protein